MILPVLSIVFYCIVMYHKKINTKITALAVSRAKSFKDVVLVNLLVTKKINCCKYDTWFFKVIFSTVQYSTVQYSTHLVSSPQYQVLLSIVLYCTIKNQYQNFVSLLVTKKINCCEYGTSFFKVIFQYSTVQYTFSMILPVSSIVFYCIIMNHEIIHQQNFSLSCKENKKFQRRVFLL